MIFNIIYFDNEIENVIKSFSNTKAKGLDMIGYELIKLISNNKPLKISSIKY